MEVVIHLRAVVGWFAAHCFQFLHQIPQQGQFVRIRVIQLPRRQRFFIEQRLQCVMAQIRRDADALDAAFMTHYLQRFAIDLVIHRQRRANAICAQGESLHHAVRQHGDFLAGHIHRGQALRRNFVAIRVARHSQRGRGNMHTDAPIAVG